MASQIIETLRRELRASLLIDGLSQAVRYVIDPATGLVIVDVPVDLLRGAQERDLTITLHVPDESPDALEALVTCTSELDHQTDPACDRWRAYHLTDGFPGWAAFRVEAARLGTDRESVTDGHAIELASALTGVEFAILRELNADRERLRGMLHDPQRDIEPPVAVGIDDQGLHLRVRHGVRRIRFDVPVRTQAEANEQINRIFSAGSTPGR